MSLVTPARYKAITGDTSPETDVQQWIDEATALLADDLGRTALEHGAHLETLWPDRRGVLYPTIPHVTAVSAGTLAWGGITGLACDGQPVDVTVTGGWVERTANPTAPNALPVQLERDIAAAAYALGHPNQMLASLPAGATSASVGDVAISFGGNGQTRSADDMWIRWSRATLRWRYRRA